MSHSSSTNHSILLDHKMVIDGVIFHEHKEVEIKVHQKGVEEILFSHLRAIGDRKYKVKKL